MMKPTLTAVMLTVASVLAACGGSDSNDTPTPGASAEPSAEIPVVDITKTADGFDAPASIPGGLTRLRIHNADTRAHAVNFLRFEGEGTLDQLVAAYTLGSTDFVAAAEEIGRLTAPEGGSGLIGPGGVTEVVLDLVPGRYVIYRFPAIGSLPGAREMEVTAAPDPTPAPPESAFTVDMLEFAYDGFPDTLPPGKTTFEVVNEGQQLHLLDVRRINEQDISAEQVRQHLACTPLPEAPSETGVGGMGELEPGDSGWVTLDLQPGVYTLICLVFDQQDGTLGKLHTDLGMHHTFTVE